MFGVKKEIHERLARILASDASFKALGSVLNSFASQLRGVLTGNQVGIKKPANGWRRKETQLLVQDLGFKIPYSPGEFKTALKKNIRVKKDGPVQDAAEVFLQVKKILENKRPDNLLRNAINPLAGVIYDHDTACTGSGAVKQRQHVMSEVLVQEKACRQLRLSIGALRFTLQEQGKLHDHILEYLKTYLDRGAIMATNNLVLVNSKVTGLVPSVDVLENWEHQTTVNIERYGKDLKTHKEKLEVLFKKYNKTVKDRKSGLQKFVEDVLKSWADVELPEGRKEKSEMIQQRCELLKAFKDFPRASSEYHYLQEIRYQ